MNKKASNPNPPDKKFKPLQPPSPYRPYFGIYDNVEYCNKEIFSAREIFSNKNTTEIQYDAMMKGLGLILLYCPKEVKDFANATYIEATMRKKYFIPLWDKEHENE